MKKNVFNKILLYVLVGCLSFGVPATTYYKSVHAFEFVGGALAFEEALKWLLAIVGVTVAGSVASQVDWSEVREQCVEVQLHNGASQAQVSEWWSKLAKGTLDKASSCWDSFLEWSDTLVSSSSGGGSLGTFYSGMSANSCLSALNSLNNTSFSFPADFSSYNVYAIFYSFNDLKTRYMITLFLTDKSSFTLRAGSRVYFSGNCNIIGLDGNSSSVFSNIYNASNDYGFSIFNDYSNYVYNITDSTGTYNLNDINTFIGSGSGSVTSDWQSAIDVARENLNLLNRDLPDENASEVAIPMPGLADSDNEVSADAYDNIVDAINDGTITLDDGIAQIQDLLHVLVIDDTTDIVQPVRPDPDTGEPEKKDDVIKENKSNMGFTLAGLEKVFPFCIPFDIYAFLTLLVAEPVAPEFDFPIKSVNNQTEEIHIDLSPFEPVAVVVRYIFDFLFIIGLALMTRSLIGGGSSD